MDGNEYEPVLRDEWVEEFLAERSLTSRVPNMAGSSRQQIMQAKRTLLRMREALDKEIEQLDRLLLRRRQPGR